MAHAPGGVVGVDQVELAWVGRGRDVFRAVHDADAGLGGQFWPAVVDRADVVEAEVPRVGADHRLAVCQDGGEVPSRLVVGARGHDGAEGASALLVVDGVSAVRGARISTGSNQSGAFRSTGSGNGDANAGLFGEQSHKWW